MKAVVVFAGGQPLAAFRRLPGVASLTWNVRWGSGDSSLSSFCLCRVLAPRKGHLYSRRRLFGRPADLLPEANGRTDGCGRLKYSL